MKNSSSTYYSWPFLYALLLHIVILGFLIIQIELPVRSAGSSAPPAENIVQAVAVSQTSLDNYQAAVTAAQQARAAAAKAAQQAQLKAQQLQQQQQLLKQQRLQAAQLAALQAAQQAAAQVKAQQQAAVKQAQAAAQVKAQQQAQKQAQLKKLKQQLAQDLNQQLASDQQQLDQNSAKITQDQGAIDKYKTLVIQAISQQWIIPPNVNNSLSCEIVVRVAPGGAVLQVTLVKSSGNQILDNSAIAAVNKASPLPVPGDPDLFDKFREINLTVRPNGSMIDNS